MRKPFILVVVSIIFFFVFACKNETENVPSAEIKTNTPDTVVKVPVKRAPKKDLTEQDRAILKSVMSRIMVEPQLKKYSSYLVSAEMITQLSEEKGPFTVFAPSTAALESFTVEQKKFYANPENREKLEEMLKLYIISEKMDVQTLGQTIEKNGSVRLKTISGGTYTVTKSGNGLSISNGKGKTAKIVKGSIEASNGVVYVIDGLLGDN